MFGLQSSQFGSEKADKEDDETCFILEPYGTETEDNQTSLMDQDRDPNDLTTPEVSGDRMTQKLYGSNKASTRTTKKRSLAARYKAQDNSLTTKKSKSSIFNSCISFEGETSHRGDISNYLQPVQDCLD